MSRTYNIMAMITACFDRRSQILQKLILMQTKCLFDFDNRLKKITDVSIKSCLGFHIKKWFPILTDRITWTNTIE